MQETIVISLGGSLIIPDQIDIGFLKDFKEIILEQVRFGKKFIIIYLYNVFIILHKNSEKNKNKNKNNYRSQNPF